MVHVGLIAVGNEKCYITEIQTCVPEDRGCPRQHPHRCRLMAFFPFFSSSEEKDGKTESKDEKGE